MFQLFRSGKIVLFQSDNNRHMLLFSKYIIFI